MGDYIGSVPNYTGPWISNGGIQPSVEFGDRKPKDQLDALSRLHDTAYAKWTDRLHRTVADAVYAEEARKLVKLFPELAAAAVQYGNFAARSLENLATKSKFGILGLITGGVQNMYHLNDYMMNKDRIRKEILDYYATDPYIKLQTYDGGESVKSDVWNPYETPLGDGIKIIPGDVKEISPIVDPQVDTRTPDRILVSAGTRTGPIGGPIIDYGPGYSNPGPSRVYAQQESYHPYEESVSNRKYFGDYKNKSMLGFTVGGDTRPVYYYPHQRVFKHLKRTKRGNKIYISK